MILLDTCTLLWLGADKSRLSAGAVDAIRGSGEFVEVSAISAWEIAWKQSCGHLDLGMRARAWFELALEVQQVRESPITASVALRAAELPRLHKDPADRFILATAMELNLPIISPDDVFRQYPGVRVIW